MVTARLATGAALDGPGDVEELKVAGVTAVIDCRAEADDAPLLAGSGLAYLWCPAEDDGQPKPDAWWDAILGFAVATYSRLGTCLLAHCAAGVNRGPSAAYAVTRACWGFGEQEARILVTAARPQAEIGYAGDFERYWAGRAWTRAVPVPGARYWHGTDYALPPGTLLTADGANAAGRKHPQSGSRHVYFTGSRADALPHGTYVYEVEPVGEFERDTGPCDEGYRTAGALRVTGG